MLALEEEARGNRKGEGMEGIYSSVQTERGDKEKRHRTLWFFRWAGAV